MRIILSEGSSLSARQAISALGPTGARIEVCDPDPLCLGRFSRFVRAWHRCPRWNVDPVGYLQFLADRLAAERYDVLLAVHDQAVLLARFRDDLSRRVGLARLSQEGIRREIRHFAQSVQSNMFVLKLGPLDKNDNRIRAVGDEISKIVTNSDVAHLEFQWMFWHL